MKNMIFPLALISYTCNHLEAEKTSIAMSIFNCCKESLQIRQLEVITSPGMWLKWLKIKILACHSYFYANMLYFFSTNMQILIKSTLKFWITRNFLKSYCKNNYLSLGCKWKSYFFACWICFHSSYLMKKDIAQCTIKLYVCWMTASKYQSIFLYWLAIIAQSGMLYCKFIFISNIYVFQYMSWVIQSWVYDMKILLQFVIGNRNHRKHFCWLYLLRHIWLTVWALLKAGLISSVPHEDQSAEYYI